MMEVWELGQTCRWRLKDHVEETHARTLDDPVTLKSVSNRSHVPHPAPANQIGQNRSQSVAGPKGETPGLPSIGLERASCTHVLLLILYVSLFFSYLVSSQCPAYYLALDNKTATRDANDMCV